MNHEPMRVSWNSVAAVGWLLQNCAAGLTMILGVFGLIGLPTAYLMDGSPDWAISPMFDQGAEGFSGYALILVGLASGHALMTWERRALGSQNGEPTDTSRPGWMRRIGGLAGGMGIILAALLVADLAPVEGLAGLIAVILTQFALWAVAVPISVKLASRTPPELRPGDISKVMNGRQADRHMVVQAIVSASALVTLTNMVWFVGVLGGYMGFGNSVFLPYGPFPRLPVMALLLIFCVGMVVDLALRLFGGSWEVWTASEDGAGLSPWRWSSRAAAAAMLTPIAVGTLFYGLVWADNVRRGEFDSAFPPPTDVGNALFQSLAWAVEIRHDPRTSNPSDMIAVEEGLRHSIGTVAMLVPPAIIASTILALISLLLYRRALLDRALSIPPASPIDEPLIRSPA